MNIVNLTIKTIPNITDALNKNLLTNIKFYSANSP